MTRETMTKVEMMILISDAIADEDGLRNTYAELYNDHPGHPQASTFAFNRRMANHAIEMLEDLFDKVAEGHEDVIGYALSEEKAKASNFHDEDAQEMAEYMTEILEGIQRNR